MTIETICNLLLDALTEAGFNESTLFNYKGVIRRFETFCNEKGVTDYTPEIGQAYADDVISKKPGNTVPSDITHKEDFQGCSLLITIPAYLISPS